MFHLYNLFIKFMVFAGVFFSFYIAICICLFIAVGFAVFLLRDHPPLACTQSLLTPKKSVVQLEFIWANDLL